jgi:hypothetical protein
VRFKHAILFALLVALVAICLSPFFVGSGVRFWIWWKARQEKLTVKIDNIDTPFLRPVILRGVRVTSAPGSAFRIDLSATQARVSLNFKRILLRTRGRPLRNLSVTGLRAEIHRHESGAVFPEETWQTWQKLLPDTINIDRADLRIENGPVVILLRGAALSVSDIEAGRFNADEFTIASPLVRQTFSRLHGATRWQENHLTLAGLSLTRGLDLQSVIVDLSHLGKQRLGLEFDLDAFGGKLRGDISNEWRSHHSNWTIAASAAEISLGQTAQAIGFASRVGGLLHAGKFTFRGDLRDPMQATASLWTELTAPAWLDREADVIMIGAALYNRQIDLQQLYVKQRTNQLTLSGEASFPAKPIDWLNLDFRGNISASVKNLDDFAALFGATRGDFAGEVAINGTLDARDRKVGGHVSANGNALTIFKTSVDELNATLNLKSTDLDLEELNLRRGEDSLRAKCKIDIGQRRNASGEIEFSVKKLSDYIAKSIFAGSVNGRFNFEGRAATSESLQLTDGTTTISLTTAVDISDWQHVHATLTPLSPIVDLSAPNASDCIDHVQIIPAPKSKQPATPIQKLELLGDLAAGIRNLKVATPSGEKEYRVLCDGGGNRALLIGTTPEKR